VAALFNIHTNKTQQFRHPLRVFFNHITKSRMQGKCTVTAIKDF